MTPRASNRSPLRPRGLGAPVALTLALVLLPVLAIAQPVAPRKVLTLDRIVAVVNGEVITRHELGQRLRVISAQLAQQKTPLPPPDVLERQVLERMISDRVLLQHARETGIRVDDGQLEKIITRIASDSKLSLPQFREALERDGLSFARFREDVRDEVTMVRLREREVEARIVVTDAEIDDLLRTRETQQNAAEELTLAHILVRLPEGASPEQIAERRARAEQALLAVRGGADFGQIAASFSDAPDALKGGDMGSRPLDRWPALFAEATRSMKVGDISPVLRSPAGFHILRVSARRASTAPVIVQQTRARHILVRINELTSETDARNRLVGLRERIENGTPFAELARLHSDDGSAARGGELGWISPGDTVPEFERTMDALKPGELSQPVRTDFGMHLIQVMERRNEDLTVERQRLLARQTIRARKADEAVQEWVRQLRDRAFVSIRLDEL
jgi:peptidyl-prolyl cis-trans isomerase SurA